MTAILAAPIGATAASRTAPAPPPTASHRLDAVDLLRGLVIALMVLDHVRDFTSNVAFVFQPTDLGRTTPALFATRWVTHLCAPTFAFLAGVGVYLQRARAHARGEPTGGVARYLLSRGLWLIVLEVTVVGFALDFRPFVFLQIIWAIGAAFVSLALLVWLPPRAVLALGIATVAGHQALAAWLAALPSAAGWLFWLAPGPLPAVFAGAPGFQAYPALPWAGIVWTGYGLGRLFLLPERERRRAQLLVAVCALALFAVLRAANGYGDPAPWSVQPRGATYTVLSVLNVSKYPPSLQYVLLTLGVALPLGLLLERLRGGIASGIRAALLAYGRTPMFTYLIHLFVVHGLALAIGVMLGHPAGIFIGMVSDASRVVRHAWGLDLAAVYLLWLAVLALLYPLSAWYARYRRGSAAWWVRYV